MMMAGWQEEFKDPHAELNQISTLKILHPTYREFHQPVLMGSQQHIQ